MAVLFALSFSHLLNDAIQALIPAIYPVLKTVYGLTFTQIGLITLTFQMVGSMFAARSCAGILYGQASEAVFAGRGHGHHVGGADCLGVLTIVSRGHPRGGDGGVGLGDFSSGILTHGAGGFRRTTWLCAITISSGRERGHGARAVAGGVDHRAARAAVHPVVHRAAVSWGCSS